MDNKTPQSDGSREHLAHTPGPWRVQSGTGWIVTEGNPYGRGMMHVADPRGWGHLTGTGGGCAFDEDKACAIQDANAHLIAAAPELLAAVKYARRYMHYPEHDVAFIDAVLAKASPLSSDGSPNKKEELPNGEQEAATVTMRQAGEASGSGVEDTK